MIKKFHDFFFSINSVHIREIYPMHKISPLCDVRLCGNGKIMKISVNCDCIFVLLSVHVSEQSCNTQLKYFVFVTRVRQVTGTFHPCVSPRFFHPRNIPPQVRLGQVKTPGRKLPGVKKPKGNTEVETSGGERPQNRSLYVFVTRVRRDCLVKKKVRCGCDFRHI